MKHVDVESSNIKSIGYDETSKTLEIRFKSGGHYSYHDVAVETHKALMGAASIGTYFSQNVKNKHKFRRVETNGHAKR